MDNILKQISALIFTFLLSAGCHSSPSDQVRQPASTPCRASDCDVDPQQGAIDAVEKEQQRILAHGTDKERWATPIWSESKSPEDLEVWLVKSAGFKMKLAPDTGLLMFEKANRRHVFRIAAPVGDASLGCPLYKLKVLDASEKHALINVNCQVFERKPNRKVTSTLYALYDAESASMRPIWQDMDMGPNPRMPVAKPLPEVKLVPGGYEFKWSGKAPSSPDLRNYNNKYVIASDKATGRKVLQCLDMNATGSARVNGGGCAEEIERVDVNKAPDRK